MALSAKGFTQHSGARWHDALLKAADLRLGEVVSALVLNVEPAPEHFTSAPVVVYLDENVKGRWAMSLNKTNIDIVAGIIGDDLEALAGKRLQVVCQQVEYNGRMVPGLRVSAVLAADGAPLGNGAVNARQVAAGPKPKAAAGPKPKK